MGTLLSIKIEQGKVFAKIGCNGYVEYQYLEELEKLVVLGAISESLKAL